MRTKLFMAIMLCVGIANAKTLRVNNAEGNSAPYTSVTDALNDAVAGDVILLEKSTKSYGDFSVGEGLTIQGEGYFADVNDISEEGATGTLTGNITLTGPNIKLTGLEAYSINFKMAASSCVITRCYVDVIALCPDFTYTDKFVTDCIIHQNYIGVIKCDTYSAPAQQIQITNNVFCWMYDGIVNIKNSVIERNTFRCVGDPCMWVKNSVFSKNISGGEHQESSNTISGNEVLVFEGGTFDNDKKVKEAETALGLDAGAFSGEDPYVLSGIPAGPRIIDLIVPPSVEQGEDLKVTVKIGISK